MKKLPVNFQTLLDWGQGVLSQEAQALMEHRFDESFPRAVELLFNSSGKVLFTGLGKSGHIAKKLAASFTSLGIPSFFLHPSEAFHGDCGVLMPEDALVALANGGETREVLNLVKFSKKKGCSVLAITGKSQSSLAKIAHQTLAFHSSEADPWGIVPTVSATMTLAIGHALALALMRAKGFQKENFAAFHPLGNLGLKLIRAKEVMRPLKELSWVQENDSFSSLLEAMENPWGIVPVLKDDALVGCVTDGDLRRTLIAQKENIFKNFFVKDVMTAAPKSLCENEGIMLGIEMMEKFHITSVFVLDEERKNLVGLLRLHDLMESSWL